MSMDRAFSPVIVAGAGPVGMTAAAMLAKARIPTVVVETDSVPKPDWRASTFHAATLELLDRIDITERMLAEGLAVPLYQFRDRVDGLVAEFDMTVLAEETRYPYRLQLNQQHLVRMLYERLEKDPCVTLMFSCELTEVCNEDDRVQVAVSTPDGPRRLEGSYLIGADGASSTVRTSLGIDFDGFTYPERFLIASTTVDLRELVTDLADVNYIADPHQWLFILHTPESWRAVWPVPAEVTADEATSPEVLQAQLQGFAAYPPGYPIIDSQLYNVHQRVAATFRLGNSVLVGDAAHINSPIGGVGLNSGIHDAVDVTTRIVRILDGEGDRDAELDTFAERRRRVAVEYVQADTERNTQRLKETDDARRRANQDELRAVAADPDRARQWLRRVSLLESVRRFGVGTPPQEAVARPPQPTRKSTTVSRKEAPAMARDRSATPAPERELDLFYEELTQAHLHPLWTITEELLTPTPRPKAIPWLWPARTMRPLAERAIELVPVERGGERRVLSLGNPGLGGRPYAAGTLWGAIQCLGPNESAPAHRHSAGAIRFVLEGEGVWTTVDGDACDMHAGDLILTPAWNWHDHTNGGEGNMFWFDGLDLPMIDALDGVFFEPYPQLRQPEVGPRNRSESEYADAAGKTVAGQVTEALDPTHSPLLVYRWKDTDVELGDLASTSDDPMVGLEFTNPRSGASVLPTLSCAMHRIKPGRSTLPHQRSGNAVHVVYRGNGSSVIAGQRFTWEPGDMFVVPSWAPVEHHSDTGADLFTLSDTPVLRALGIYREQTLDRPQEVVDTFRP